MSPDTYPGPQKPSLLSESRTAAATADSADGLAREAGAATWSLGWAEAAVGEHELVSVWAEVHPEGPAAPGTSWGAQRAARTSGPSPLLTGPGEPGPAWGRCPDPRATAVGTPPVPAAPLAACRVHPHVWLARQRAPELFQPLRVPPREGGQAAAISSSPPRAGRQGALPAQSPHVSRADS